MFKYLDPYTLRARLSPAIIAAAPAFAAVALLISWTQFSLSNTIATVGLVALLFALADIARRQGKKIQPQLFAQLGGPPSITMLRHMDKTLDGISKARYVAFLGSKINEAPPTEAQETSDPAAADAFYARCGDWLRENTRNTKKFNILFNENVTYGFRRNLLGTKWSALALNLLVVLISAGVLYHGSVPFQDISHVEGRVIVVLVVAVLHAIYIGVGVNRSVVAEAAKSYGRQLILSCETLMSKAAPSAPSKPKKPPKTK
ncbi:hypothetical protein [Bradyrhizobium sp. DOA1]|uniref:hypothetical protein n=1 Tax=Bradyrhizobium sp. DOA1 TaxID=1126616 RepID=UPI00077C1A9D|nr:hypothetical protein [Bradyrhizobium sp. DOA1]KYH01913.1 hypothetical protein SE91_28750 [Bradyrhizobium sp. DOA1]